MNYEPKVFFMKKLCAGILAVFVLCVAVAAQDNSFIKMAGKPFAAYCDELQKVLYDWAPYTDADARSWATQTAAQLRETGKMTKDKRWELEADFFELKFEHFHNISMNDYGKAQTDSLEELYIGNLQKNVLQARKIKAIDIELRSMVEIWDRYYLHFIDNIACIEYGKLLDERLATVRVDDFPFRPYC